MMAETCAYCDRPFNDLVQKRRDHIIPKTLGGNNGSANLTPACVECNTLKGAHTPKSLRALSNDVWQRHHRMLILADRIERLMWERGLSIGEPVLGQGGGE